MNILNKYKFYFIIYGYIFLLFLKGYYPANETGILFIGFLIFMTLSYNFGGSIISSELDARRKEIYLKIENLLDINYNSINLLKNTYNKIISYDSKIDSYSSNYPVLLTNNINNIVVNEMDSFLNYGISSHLTSILKEELTLENQFINTAYLLATKRLIDNKLI